MEDPCPSPQFPELTEQLIPVYQSVNQKVCDQGGADTYGDKLLTDASKVDSVGDPEMKERVRVGTASMILILLHLSEITKNKLTEAKRVLLVNAYHKLMPKTDDPKGGSVKKGVPGGRRKLVITRRRRTRRRKLNRLRSRRGL